MELARQLELSSLLNATNSKATSALKNVSIVASTYENGDLKKVHVEIGNIKSFLLGTYPGGCGDYQSNLNAFCSLYNHRFQPAEILT